MPVSARARRAPALLALLLLAASCRDSASPERYTPAEVAGRYVAGTDQSATFGVMLVTEAGHTEDWLARGATVDITLTADGATSGRLVIPDVPSDDGDGRTFTLDASMAGTWTLDPDGRTVTLDQDADTFMRDIPLVVRGDGRLEGSLAGTDTKLRLVLVRR